ncbi:MAG: hypothetical protein CL872_01265, partial [Dehalococcoidaceae bacterium]|nr:hypothetical protein [Dehalococcoidaceae bacterium]
TNTDIDEESSGYSFLLGANITEDSDLTVSFIKNAGNEKFSFLESLSEIIPVNTVKNHFIFANDKSIKKKFTLRYNKFFKNGINFQLYHEYFAESHKYDNYSELSMDSEYPSTQTDYILSDNFYCDVGDPNLDPEYSTQYDISFKSPAPMGFFTSSLFYHEITDKIEWYDDDSFANLDVLTFKNSAKAYEHGMSFFMILAGQVLGGTYSKSSLSDTSDDYELNESSTFKNMYFQMRLPEEYISPYVNWWKFDFEYGFYWMQIKTPTGTLFGEDGSLWGELSLSKKFLDNRLRVSLSVNNLHNNPGFQMLRTKPLDNPVSSEGITYDSAFETTDTYNQRNGQTVSLSFRYNFGKLEDDKNQGRRKSFEKDGERGGGMDMGY